MIARRFAISSSSFLSKLVNPKIEIQKLSTSSQVISLSKEELEEALKKKNDEDLAVMRKAIVSEARNSNFVFSPALINSVLALKDVNSISEVRLAVFKEIANVVFPDGSASGGPKIKVVNGIWVDQTLPVNDSFKHLLENVFKATFTQVDFRNKAEQVRTKLNKWTSKQTNGLINYLLPPGSITSETDQVYGNALYFKGVWYDKFKKSNTTVKDFHLLNGSSVSVPFMSNNKDHQYIEAYDGFKVLILAFRQGCDFNRNFSMHFYLPDEKDGLDNLLEKMTSTPGFVDEHIPWHRVQVSELRIPKFKFSFGFEASRAFERLDSMALYHKACVEIDEEGAEAAAGCYRIPICASNYKIDFVADHPFLFLIKEDETETVLFAGQVVDPSKSS